MTDVPTFFKPPRRKRTSKSRKTARRDRAYTRWREDQLRLRPWCEAKRPGICTRRTVLLHHRRLVKQGGAKMLPANTVASCNDCHVWIHHNVSQARIAGLLVSVRDEEFGELGAARDPIASSFPKLIFLILVGAFMIAVAGIVGVLALLLLFVWLDGAAW